MTVGRGVFDRVGGLGVADNVAVDVGVFVVVGLGVWDIFGINWVADGVAVKGGVGGSGICADSKTMTSIAPMKSTAGSRLRVVSCMGLRYLLY